MDRPAELLQLLCPRFKVVVLRSDQNDLKASLVLNGKLDYNDRMIYHIQLRATDSLHQQTTDLEIRVKDVQNSPPVFFGSLAAVIDEDSKIGTLVMTIQARDGDKGQPRRISYELVTSKCLSVILCFNPIRDTHNSSPPSYAYIPSIVHRSHGLLPSRRTNG